MCKHKKNVKNIYTRHLYDGFKLIERGHNNDVPSLVK